MDQDSPKMQTLQSGDTLNNLAPSTISQCGSTTPEAEKLASLDSALDLMKDYDDQKSETTSLAGALIDETPVMDFSLGPPTPPQAPSPSNVIVHVHPPDSEKSKSRSGSGDSSQNTNMTDSQEWEKIDDSEVKKINPDDIKESEPESEYDDILGSGQILKKVLVAGLENSRPTRGNRAVVNVVGKLGSGDIVEEYENLELSVGDTEINQGVDLLLPLMNKGETCEAIVNARFCYGPLGLDPKIPADATMHYRIELVEFNEEEMETVEKIDRIRIGNIKKERGNFWFNRQAYASAVQLYRRALDYLDENASDNGEDDSDKKDPEEPVMRQIWEDRLKVYNNLAAAQMKLEAYDAALRSVDCVLRCQPKNVKALFRKAKILTAKGETEEALTAMKEANQLVPEDKGIEVELKRLLEKKKAESQEEKNLYKKMLKDVTASPPPPTKTLPARKPSLLDYGWQIALTGCLAAGLAFAVYRMKHE